MSQKASLTLRLHDSHGAFREVEITTFPATVGRQEGCDIWIDDPKVSREHLRIEQRDDALYCVDLGSRNGFRWNGATTREARLKKDGRLRVGQSRIEVLEASVQREREVPRAPSRQRRNETSEPAPVLAGVQARRQRMRMFAVGIVACLVLGIGYYVTNKVVGRSDAVDPRVAEATADVEAFDTRLAKTERVTPRMLASVEELCQRYEGVEFVGANPLYELRSHVRQRYTLEQRKLLADAIATKRRLLDERRFGQLLAHLRGLVDGFDGDRNTELTLTSMLRESEKSVARSFAAVLEDLNYLESGVADAAEIDRRYAEVLAEFENTSYLDQLTQRRAARPAVVAVATNTNDEPVEARNVPTTVDLDDELLTLLRGVLAGEGFGKRKYRFTVFEGTPLRIDDSSVVHVKTADGERALPFKKAPKATRLLMAHDTLVGEELLTAVKVAHAWGHEVVAGKMLQRFVQDAQGKSERNERRVRVGTILAAARGYAAVPEGGFDYDEKYGWETEADRTERVVLVAVERTTEKFSPRTKVSSLQKSVDEITEHLANDELSTRLRQKIRTLAVESLQGLRELLAADIGKNATKMLAPLRAEKEELNRLRAVAKKVIYDPEIYLPEDHPDWTKGDKINGQSEVDEKVRAVREIWDAAATKKIVVPKAAWRAVSTIRILDTELLPRFGVRAPKEADPRLSDLLRNPYPELSVRNFSLDDKEAAVYRFSRQVEDYNRAFSNPDLSEQDQGHFYVMNDYREMFGHQRCFIDIRLCRATKKHSAVCNAAGSIWHDGPNGTPQSRANAEGFESGVAENVAIGYGNPKGIWTVGWYRASDHHRNALAESHNCLGYGYVGSVGTQNFATIDPPFEVQ
ncbi:MAG: FHA domain-containing protein [Planctomycetota bacterium]